MARKPGTTTKEKHPQDTHTVQEVLRMTQGSPPERVVQPSDVIPEGDFAGMTYDEVMILVSGQVNDAYANLSIQGVCAVHDIVLRDILEIVNHYDGPGAAHEAAIRFGQTLMPYLSTLTPNLSKAYGELMRLRHESEGGEE